MPALAFLHGFAGDPASWEATLACRELIVHRDAIVPALPGHGAGPVRDTWADNLEAVAAAIGDVEVVVGYSLGARIALGLVATGRVRCGVLISVNPGIADAERSLRRSNDARLARMLRSQGMAVFVEAWQAQPLFATQWRADPRTTEQRRERRLALDPEQLARSLETMGLAEMPDYRAVIRPERFSLVVGADDTKYFAIARGLSAPLHAIANSGHDPTLEQPAALAAALAREIRRLTT